MKTLITVVATVIMLNLFSGTNALAQRGIMWKGGGGWGPGTPYSRMYNPKTVETIRGEVVSVDKIIPK
ncbi:MAG: DNA-binding protein, partial [Deltaproteobacteria bacterium]